MSARENIIPVFVPHLGCPNNCVFCNQNRITGRPEPATAKTVSDAVQAADAMGIETGNRQLAFYGGSFTAIPAEQQEELLSAAYAYLLKGRLDSLRLSTRPDAIDPEILKRLKRYNVETIELGAQSLDEEVLLLSGRGHTAQDVVDASRLIKANGFRLIIQMMTGLPGDSDDKCLKTAEKIIAIKPDGVRIYPTVIVRDTPLYDLWKAGRYSEHTVEDAVRVCSKLLPMFEDAGIPVIRLGLNPTDDLSSGDAAAGAYHPALGELVKSRILYDELVELLEGTEEGSSVTVLCPKSKISQLIGQHRCNVVKIKGLYGLKSFTVKEREDGLNEISLQSTEKQK